MSRTLRKRTALLALPTAALLALMPTTASAYPNPAASRAPSSRTTRR